jgi:adenosylcobinamide kinase/adenosylcobinamide-phosphate guanylyltransferase
MHQLILGGARSGKSALAERLASASGKAVTYIATTDARANDTEMDARIAHHRRQRPASWPTLEAPRELARCLRETAAPDRCLLVDCLTLWVTNCLLSDAELRCAAEYWELQRREFLATLPALPGDIILVSNEVGWGIVPLGELSRRFVDETGFLHQATAALADRVVLTAAGLPLVLKGEPL